MKLKDVKYVLSKIDDEGFDYCFLHYSDFREIEDEEFHRLRDNYLKAQKQLEEYLLYSKALKEQKIN